MDVEEFVRLGLLQRLPQRPIMPHHLKLALMSEAEKNTASYYFQDSETKYFAGQIQVPKDSEVHLVLQHIGYVSITGTDWGPGHDDTHLINYVTPKELEHIRKQFPDVLDTRAAEYSSWLRSLKDSDLEDEYEARRLDDMSDGQNEEYEGQYHQRFTAAAMVRLSRKFTGRYLESEN